MTEEENLSFVFRKANTFVSVITIRKELASIDGSNYQILTIINSFSDRSVSLLFANYYTICHFQQCTKGLN